MILKPDPRRFAMLLAMLLLGSFSGVMAQGTTLVIWADSTRAPVLLCLLDSISTVLAVNLEDRIPFFARNSAVDDPPGPPPMIRTSVFTDISGKPPTYIKNISSNKRLDRGHRIVVFPGRRNFNPGQTGVLVRGTSVRGDEISVPSAFTVVASIHRGPITNNGLQNTSQSYPSQFHRR